MKDARLTPRRIAILAAKIAVVAALVWGVHRTVNTALAELANHEWSPSRLKFGWLVAAGLLYLASLFPSALFWHGVLRALGQQPRLMQTIRAYYIGHLGKYVPGKALVVVLRTGLVRGPQVDTAVAAASIFYETLTMMAVGSFVGGGALAIWFRHQTWLMLVAIGMMLVSGLPTLPPIFRRIVAIAAGRRIDPAVLTRFGQISFRLLVLGWLGIAIGWCLNGLSLYLVIGASGFEITPEVGEKLLLCTIAGALSVVAGFLSLIPGGAVVREAVLIALLPPYFGQIAAVVSALVARLVSLVAELAISVILYVSARIGAARDRRPPP